jgi:alkylhydroperoxidase family enzyme
VASARRILSNAPPMSDVDEEPNPYAPPRPETSKVRRRPSAQARSRSARGDVAEALERLDEHLSDPEAVENDRRAAGRRVRTVTLVFVALFVPSLLLVAAGASDSHGVMLPLGIGFAVITGLLAAILLGVDLTLVERGKPSTPEAALKSVYKAVAMNRCGYAWSVLGPTAREQTVSTPLLRPVETLGGDFSLSDEPGMKAYTSSFARAGHGTMRTLAVKKISVASFDGDDVVEVEALLGFQSWPQWISILLGLGAAIFRPLLLVGGILYFVMRKRREVRVTKTMLRGRNGAWYLLDGDLVEGVEESE